MPTFLSSASLFFDVSLLSLYLVSQINVPYQEMFLRIWSFQFLVARRFSIVWHILPLKYCVCIVQLNWRLSHQLLPLQTLTTLWVFLLWATATSQLKSFTHSEIFVGFTHGKVQWVPSAVPWALERQGWERGSVERTVRKIAASGEGASFILGVLTFVVARVPPTRACFCASLGLDCSS